MDDLYQTVIRQRYNSSMTYQEYLDTHDQPPPTPALKAKQSPQIVEPLILEPPKGPKIQQQKLAIYTPDEVILEESETDEKQRSNQIPKVPCQKALIEHNVRIRSQSENLGFSVFRFLQQKKKV
ncbi:unnamed protein product [Paramecium primaurelia]|uniref:Uncharacterized protein n=2 Tax=Paramecium TaxID=5884 RepID=A0A8S1SVM9_9CILI|nr:unnamed protein product [Paramecium primaurelia]CAD8143277.1 unnamed protein product [Paramecium pentaurelia]